MLHHIYLNLKGFYKSSQQHGYFVVIGKSEYTTFGNLECSKNGTNGAAFLAIRNAA